MGEILKNPKDFEGQRDALATLLTSLEGLPRDKKNLDAATWLQINNLTFELKLAIDKLSRNEFVSMSDARILTTRVLETITKIEQL